MSAWTELHEYMAETEQIQQACGVLRWDQQTYMPAGGAVGRGKQLAALSNVLHERMTSDRLRGLIDTISETPAADMTPVQQASLRNIRRQVDKATCTPAPLVKALAQATTSANGAWVAARSANDFSRFAPELEQLLALLKESASHRGPAAHVYDHFLGDYDQGTTTAQLQPMFARLSEELGPLVDEAVAQPQPAPIRDTLPLDGLKALNKRVVEALGFRMEDGRLDESAHPFTLGLVPSDVRLTTRYHTDNLLGTLFGTIHETGHGLYEQGLPSRPGTLTDHSAGTGIHESQSRFWENVIGRSRPFAAWLAEQIAIDIPSLDMDADRLFAALNRVSRSLIRIHADELTYNLHIIVRFQLELALIEGTLAVADLPDAWSDAYANVVGVRPDSPAEGVLQDIHWSMGLFGYFPSYTIGNLYAASQRFAMEADLPEMWTHVRNGEFTPIRDWLRTRIHQPGSLQDGPALQAAAVGTRDPVVDLMAHFRQRRAEASEIG